MVKDSGSVDRGAVGEVASLGEVETHEGVARLETSHDDGHISLRSRVGLDIGVFGVVYLLETVYGQILDLVNHLASTIVPFPGITLGVLVGADRAHGLEDIVAHVILRRNQFKSGRLPFLLISNQIENLKILFHKRCVKIVFSGL